MRCIIICITLFLFMSEFSTAQNGYLLPPKAVTDIIDADPSPSVSFSPDRKYMLLIDRDAMPSIEEVSRPMLRLAGMRIDPVANSRFSTSFRRGIRFKTLEGKKEITIGIPEGAKIGSISWSHLSNAFAFVTISNQGSALWVSKVDDPASPILLTNSLNTIMQGFDWMPDGKSILCHLVPNQRGNIPTKKMAPSGPNIQESLGAKSPTRTYQDLLSSPHDEALFEYYAKTQLALITLDRKQTLLKKPAIYAQSAVSPDGESILVSQIQKPYSYLMTYRSFPRKVQVWSLGPKGITETKTIADIPMAENIPIQGVRTGKRNIDWHSSRPATLVWSEALDGGDPNVKADFRDKLMQADAPFDDPQELLKLQHRFSGITFTEVDYKFITTEYDRDRRWITSKLHNLKQSQNKPVVLEDRSIRDRYNDPGRVITVADGNGHAIVRMDGDWIYRSGAGASSKGNLPFIDRQNVSTLKSERLWRCSEGFYETVVAILPENNGKAPDFITSKESKSVPPNYILHRVTDGSEQPLTDFKDPTPQIRGIKKQLVRYEREDGVPLSATLYLPADYKEGQRLPLLVWAYPREYNDVKTAGQVSGSPNRFTRMTSISHLTFLTQGYAIMDNATMPVIGDPETMNDTFIEQIVAAAQAAIDKAVELGVADRDRVGVGGHSYGAFMTANLLAHCDLFKAGIARSGAYNRTLTPFGFQSERRAFWEAKDVYFNISPFMHANKINEPILLTHGENDNNSGTFPIQSRRLYQAIKGNGGTVRLVMLPGESHGYRARESILHTQAEMINWFNTYVKGE